MYENMEKITIYKISTIFLALVLFIHVTFVKYGDITSKTFLTRIEALEKREIEREVRIVLLETQVDNFKEKLSYLTSSNNELHQVLAGHARTVQDTKGTIVKLKQDFTAEKNTMKEKTKDLHDKVEQFKALINDLHAGQRSSEQAGKDVDDNEGKYDNHLKPQITSYLSAETVAFHARQIRDSVTYPNIHDVIKFENVTLNKGNGYHFRQGLFIAPQSGLYIFSITITAESGDSNNVWASIMKNGNAIARIQCLGSDKDFFSDQSSVTMVTWMDISDELWTELYSSGNVTTLGNGFSTFSGMLVQ